SITTESSQSEMMLYTPGFVPPHRRNRTSLLPEDDFYSLGSVIYSLIFPVQEFFQLSPDATDVFIDEIARDYRLPHYMKEMIFALLHNDVNRARPIAESAEVDHVETQMKASYSDADRRPEIDGVIQGTMNYILSKTDLARQDRLWPSDYRVFSTNPL